MNYRDSTITPLRGIVPKDKRAVSLRGTSTTSGIHVSMRSYLRVVRTPSKAGSTRCAWRANSPVRRKTWVACRVMPDYLKTIKDRDHRESVETLEWAEGGFDPDEFDAATATKSMWKGIVGGQDME